MRRSARHGRRPRGFTLIELLVVVLIVLLISAVTLPVAIPAFNHRQVGESARILQAGLVTARDAAIRSNSPHGIRLLPDPTLSPLSTSGTGATTGVLAYNRWVAIETAPDYSIGSVSIKNIPPFNAAQMPPIPPQFSGTNQMQIQGNYPYNALAALNGNVPWVYPLELCASLALAPLPPPQIPANAYPPNVLTLEEEPYQDGGAAVNPGSNPVTFSPLIPNEPVNFWWNIRLGDKIQIGNEGSYYTVIGPCEVRPTNPTYAGQNPELFVNVGPPGTSFSVSDPSGSITSSATGDSPLARAYILPNGTPFLQTVQFLFLVDGVDDDSDGYTDNGWNGADENVNGIVDDILEWYQTPSNNPNAIFLNFQEQESWQGALNPKHHGAGKRRRTQLQANWDLPYSITRRPTPSPGARVTTLPSNVVIDATTAGGTNERSRIPIEAPTLQTNPPIDILLNPNGTVVPTTIYSNPNSIGFGNFFYHFWLTERVDAVAPQTPTGTSLNHLPFPKGVTSGQSNYLQGERSLITLFSKNGQIVSNSIENFSSINLNLPFQAAQEGIEEAK